jgi:hypothetical protein
MEENFDQVSPMKSSLAHKSNPNTNWHTDTLLESSLNMTKDDEDFG